MNADLFTRLARRALEDRPALTPVVEDPWAGIVDATTDELDPALAAAPASVARASPPAVIDAPARGPAGDRHGPGAADEAAHVEPAAPVSVAQPPTEGRSRSGVEVTTVLRTVVHQQEHPLPDRDRVANAATVPTTPASTSTIRREQRVAAPTVQFRPVSPPSFAAPTRSSHHTGSPIAESPPTIEITIGSIDVHPPTPRHRDDGAATRPHSRAVLDGGPPARPLTLADYLAQRSRRR